MKEPGGADLYEALEIKWIGGRSPELILYPDNDQISVIERIDITPYSSAELHNLLKEKGFILKGEPRILVESDEDEDDVEDAYCGKTKTQLMVEERVARMSYLDVFLEAPIYNSGMAFAFFGLILLAVHMGNRVFFKDDFLEAMKKEIEESKKFRERYAKSRTV